MAQSLWHVVRLKIILERKKYRKYFLYILSIKHYNYKNMESHIHKVLIKIKLSLERELKQSE